MKDAGAVASVTTNHNVHTRTDLYIFQLESAEGLDSLRERGRAGVKFRRSCRGRDSNPHAPKGDTRF
jgi:hypothetical protein